jgi:hypothetical protein
MAARSEHVFEANSHRVMVAHPFVLHPPVNLQPSPALPIPDTCEAMRLLSCRVQRTGFTANARFRTALLYGVAILALGALGPFAAHAQVYVDGGNTRHRFAQMTLGADARTFPADGSSVGGTLHEARFIIGGTHFWGHADFFVAVPVRRFGDSPFRTRVETGARYYPWRLTRGAVRPWVGASLMSVQYRQGDGPILGRARWPLTAGLTYQTGDHLLSLGVGAVRYTARYPDSPGSEIPITMHPRWFSLGYTRAFDVTTGAEPAWKSGETAKSVERRLADGTLGGFTIGIGPSSAFFSRASEHLRHVGFAGQHRQPGFFADAGVGYHFARPDLHMGVAYRRNSSAVGAYGYAHEATRSAWTLETYKFLFDYNGFVPFVGPHLSYERLAVRGSVRGDATLWRGGVTFGWDIRPDRLQSLILRTNLRYTPNLDVTVTDGRRVALDQIEFNFIQVVIYPRRFF